MRVGLLFVMAGLLALAACGPRPAVYDPTLGMHLGRDGQIYPSASGNFGGLSVGATSGGGVVGTRFGPLRLSAGF